jgi:hypothetical protein
VTATLCLNNRLKGISSRASAALAEVLLQHQVPSIGRIIQSQERRCGRQQVGCLFGGESVTIVVECHEDQPTHRIQGIVQSREGEMRITLMLHLVVAGPPIRMRLLAVILAPLVPRRQRESVPWNEDVLRSESWNPVRDDRLVAVDV